MFTRMHDFFYTNIEKTEFQMEKKFVYNNKTLRLFSTKKNKTLYNKTHAQDIL